MSTQLQEMGPAFDRKDAYTYFRTVTEEDDDEWNLVLITHVVKPIRNLSTRLSDSLGDSALAWLRAG